MARRALLSAGLCLAMLAITGSPGIADTDVDEGVPAPPALQYVSFEEASARILRSVVSIGVLQREGQQEYVTHAPLSAGSAPTDHGGRLSDAVDAHDHAAHDHSGHDHAGHDHAHPLVRGARLVQKASPGLVGAGAGTLISSDGLILTANHVIGNSPILAIQLHDGRIIEGPRREILVGADPDADLALLRLPMAESLGLDDRVAVLGDSDQVRVGQWVAAAGHPAGFDWSITVGIISGLGRRNLDFGSEVQILDQDFIQHTADISPGSSGGPLVNPAGEVIGINLGVYKTNRFISFSLPVNQMRPVVEALKTHGRPLFPTLGIVGAPSRGAGRGPGILVLGVRAGSVAQECGIRVRDVLLRINGVLVSDQADIWRTERRLVQGDTVRLMIRRGEYVLVTEVTPRVPGESGADSAVASRTGMPFIWKGYAFHEEDGAVQVITQLEPGAPGNLEPGSVIEQVGRVEVRTLDDFLSRLQTLNGWERECVLTVNHEGRRRQVRL